MEQIQILQVYRVVYFPTRVHDWVYHSKTHTYTHLYNICSVFMCTTEAKLTVRLSGGQAFVYDPDVSHSSCRGITFSTLAVELLLKALPF